MLPEPQAEHRWLQRMVGEWTSQMECVPGPGQEPMTTRGTERVYSLGGLWVIGEGEGEMPGGGTAQMRMTLGYDPARQKFVGTFVGSMMTHMWVYEGTLDAAGNVLTLDTEGPNMMAGGLARYQDIVTLASDGHRILTSRIQGEDGTWTEFMTARYRRVA